MLISCKVKDFDKHPSFTKWFNEMDAWAVENNIDPQRVLFEVKESPYSRYNMSLTISYLDVSNPLVRLIEENYYVDQEEVEKILSRFKQIDINFFRIRILDHIKFQNVLNSKK